jgi:hypothetical protein
MLVRVKQSECRDYRRFLPCCYYVDSLKLASRHGYLIITLVYKTFCKLFYTVLLCVGLHCSVYLRNKSLQDCV